MAANWLGTGNWLGVKPVSNMTDEEFADYSVNQKKTKARNDQLAQINGTTTSNNDTTSLQQQAKDMASFQLENANKQMDLSYSYRKQEKSQDDTIARSQGEQQYGFQRGLADQGYGFQRGLADQGYNNQRGLADQSYTNQRGLADQSYSFQRGLADQQNTQQTAMQSSQYGQERTMFNMQDASRQRDTQSARQAANSLYFGRSRNRRGFQGRG